MILGLETSGLSESVMIAIILEIEGVIGYSIFAARMRLVTIYIVRSDWVTPSIL